MSDHIYRTLSHKANSDLTFTYLGSLSKVQHSGRANHNVGNGQELQPCLPVSQGQHLTDERIRICFPAILKGQGKRKTSILYQSSTFIHSCFTEPLCSLHSVASFVGYLHDLCKSKSAFPDKMLLNNFKELLLLAPSAHGTAE